MKYGTIKRMAALLILIAVFASVFPGKADASPGRFNSTYIYFGKPASYIDMIADTGNSLNQVSPSYFDLNSDGTLKLNPSVDTNLISVMHTRGIKVVPFLSNQWDRQKGINALKNSEALAQQLVDAIGLYDLDGVDVDIENVTQNEKSMYVDFVRLLREKLPEGKSVTVAAAANPNGWSNGWQGSYDYAGLAKYCDHLIIMAYDEHYQGSAEGPVASAGYVEASINYALKYIPPEKIVLGIPFYGRFWKQGSSNGGYGLSNHLVDTLISKYGGKVTFDKISRSPNAVITIKPEDEKPVILGKALEAGTYSIWYENEESIKYKLQLVQKYNLKGTASWSLGQETADTWKYYRLWLDGRYFTDIDGHWAQSSIYNSVQNGWMIGATSTLFMPDQPLTRAQAAVVLVRMLGLSTTANKATYRDTTDHWAWKEIEAAREAGIVQGIGDGYFGPENKITREQMAVILDRLLKNLENPAGMSNIYNDVSNSVSPWAYDSILKMTYYDIMQGYSDNSFKPGYMLTRAQMAALMERINGYLQ